MSELNLPAWAAYPARPLHRALYRLPILEWRLGLGPLFNRTLLILSTTGRKSGLVRRAALQYHVCGDHVYVLNGYGERPDWYRNLLADPRVTLQSARGLEHARARRVTSEHELNTAYDCFEQSRALRVVAQLLGVPMTRATFLDHREQFCLIAFDPTDEPTPPPLPADLAWVWPVALTALALGWLSQRRPQRAARAGAAGASGSA